MRSLPIGILILAACAAGCQSPTDPSETDTVTVDEFVTSTVTPDPIAATESQGRTYRVVVGNNQPDEWREYDWFASFQADVTITDAIQEVEDSEGDPYFTFPITITSTNVKMAQASGGILNPPTGGQTENYEALLVSSTGNRFADVNSTVGLVFNAWYDMPSLRREAIATVTVSFKDDEGLTFTKTIEAAVAP